MFFSNAMKNSSSGSLNIGACRKDASDLRICDFGELNPRLLSNLKSKVIVVSRFAALDCFENVAKTLLAEKDMVFLHHPPSRLIIR